MNQIEIKRRKLELLKLKQRYVMPDQFKIFKQPCRYKFSWSGRGIGKSVSYGKMFLEIANKQKTKILCTREIQNSIKDSVHSLLSGLINDLMYEGFTITDNSIYHQNGSEFIFMGLWQQEKKQTLKSLYNVDYVWVEEAQSVSAGSLKILDPTIRKENSEIWFSFNRLMPDDPVWLFKESIPDNEKFEVSFNWYDNYLLPSVLRKQAERSRYEYEHGLNDDYQHIWLGEPIGFSEKTIIPYRFIQAAVERIIEPNGQIEIGADIARYGHDRTVFIKRKGLKMIDYKVYPKNSITECARYLIDFAGNNINIPIKIDDTGVGAGVTDYLKDYGFNTIPVNFGQVAKDQDRYNNAISEMWFEFKNNLNQIDLLDIQELKSELSTREWKIDNKGRRCVESKEDYKKRGFKSPDFADACLLAYYEKQNDKPVFIKKRIM